MNRGSAALLLLCAVLATAAPARSSNLLVNGSFETSSGGYIPSNQPDRRFNDGSLVVPGWNFAIGLSSDVYRDLNATGAQSSYYDAADGDWLAGCGSFFTLHEGVSQTFNVVGSTWHRVTFRMAPGGLNYSGSWIENASVGSSWQVDVTGAVASSVSQSFASDLTDFDASQTTNPLAWTQQTLYFLSNAAGGPVTLQFTAYGDLTHVFLDDVVVTEWPAPIADDCSTALTIVGPGPHPFDNTVASTGTQGQAEAACLYNGQTAIEHDQWFVWTAGANGNALLLTCGGIAFGSGEDTKVAIYSGNACPTAPALACNDDVQCGSSAVTSIVSWPIACGQQYRIQLGRAPGASASWGTFTIQEFGTGCLGTGTVFCAGDGTATACPCGNLGSIGHGCASSVAPGGAVLSATGTARVSGDTVVLAGDGMPNSSALYFQGTQRVNNGAGAVFGDGLRCAGGSLIRLRTKINVGGRSVYPDPGEPPISVRGAIPASGGVRQYQVWYRNAASFCTPSTFNVSNGLEIDWLP